MSAPQQVPQQVPAPRRPVVWLSVQQIARDLDLSKMTIYRLIEREELRGYRIGRSIRVRSNDLENYLMRARQAAAFDS